MLIYSFVLGILCSLKFSKRYSILISVREEENIVKNYENDVQGGNSKEEVIIKISLAEEEKSQHDSDDFWNQT